MFLAECVPSNVRHILKMRVLKIVKDRKYSLFSCSFPPSVTAVIMTPTRELALQITKECKKFSKPLGLRVVCVYGGTGISEQVNTHTNVTCLFYFLTGLQLFSSLQQQSRYCTIIIDCCHGAGQSLNDLTRRP